MSVLIDHELKDRVRNAVDIVDVVGSVLELRRQGSGFVAQCPWHDDRRPSLQVNPTRQSWKCWVCDIGGDIFSFVMKREGVSFPEALQLLADRAGITIDRTPDRRAGPVGKSSEKKHLYDAMSWVTLQYHQFFLKSSEAETARKYVESRGISKQSIEKFQIGYAPGGWTWLLDRALGKGMDGELLERIGVARHNEQGKRYDFFRDRVIFPIRDVQGRPVALGGRVLPGASSDVAKYMNGNETRLYSKSNLLYGLDSARDAVGKSRQAIVVEGYTDVIACHQFGVTNAVAVCGTALGESHIRLLKRYCDSVILLLDGDEAGQRRMNDLVDLFLHSNLDMRVLTLPDGLDPCDYLNKHGQNALVGLLQQATDAVEHRIRVACRGFDPLLDTHRANAALEEILRTLAAIPDVQRGSHSSFRLRLDQVLVRISRQFGIDERRLRERLHDIRKSKATQQVARFRVDDTSMTEEQRVLRYADLTPFDREVFEIMICHPQFCSQILERIPVDRLESETARLLYKVYSDAELEGSSLDFDRLMSCIEDVDMKNLLVSIDTEADRKLSKCDIDADTRLRDLFDRIADVERKIMDRQRLQDLEKKQLSEEEEMILLLAMVEQARSRHELTDENVD